MWLQRAVAWFAEHGVTVERVPSDNGSANKSFVWRDACTDLQITPKRTPPLPAPDQRQEQRCHRTLADGWAYARLYKSTNNAIPH